MVPQGGGGWLWTLGHLLYLSLGRGHWAMGDQKKGAVARSQSPGLAQGGLGSRDSPRLQGPSLPICTWQLDPCDPDNLAMPGQVLVAKGRPVLPLTPTTPWVPLSTARARPSQVWSSACPSHVPGSLVPRKSPKASASAGSHEEAGPRVGRERLEPTILSHPQPRHRPAPVTTQTAALRAAGPPHPKGSQDVREPGHVWPRPRPC